MKDAHLNVYRSENHIEQLLKRTTLLKQELNTLKAQARPISMIGAGMLHNDFVQVSNATENAVGWLDYGLHETVEGKNVQDAFKIWADSKEAQDFKKVAE